MFSIVYSWPIVTNLKSFKRETIYAENPKQCLARNKLDFQNQATTSLNKIRPLNTVSMEWIETDPSISVQSDSIGTSCAWSSFQTKMMNCKCPHVVFNDIFKY